MEDLFYIPERKICIDEINLIVQEHYSYKVTKILDEDYIGSYVRIDKYNTYWEYFFLLKSEILDLQYEEPQFWNKVEPRQILCITHKRAFFHLLKPFLLILMDRYNGYVCLNFDKLYVKNKLNDSIYDS